MFLLLKKANWTFIFSTKAKTTFLFTKKCKNRVSLTKKKTQTKDVPVTVKHNKKMFLSLKNALKGVRFTKNGCRMVENGPSL